MNGVSNLFAAAPAKRVRRLVIEHRQKRVDHLTNASSQQLQLAVAVSGELSATASAYSHSFSSAVLKKT
jgi:hypothetical protein